MTTKLKPGGARWIEEFGSDDDPCGLVGCRVENTFDGEVYSGAVESWSAEDRWYRLVYSDGDAEDVTKTKACRLVVGM